MTARAQHTPGPWRADYNLADGTFKWSFRVTAVDRGGERAIICNTATCGTSDEGAADALLITAAPELLAVAAAVIAWEPSCWVVGGCNPVALCPACLARAALAKALGGQL